MVNLVYNQLQENILERKKVDKPLLNWFLLTFVLSWLTLGIAVIYVFIERILRVDKYIRRKYEFFDILIHFIEIESKERKLDNNDIYISTLKNRLTKFKREIHPVMPFVIKVFIPVAVFTLFIICFIAFTDLSHIPTTTIIIVLVIWGIDTSVMMLIYMYKMNRIWDDIQQFESDMYETISEVFISFKLIDHPVIYYTDPKIRKNFIIYTILGFITCGIWFVVWDYQVYTAPDNMYNIFHKAEDTMVEVVRSCCKRD